MLGLVVGEVLMGSMSWIGIVLSIGQRATQRILSFEYTSIYLC